MSVLVKVKFGYGCDAQLKALSEEDYARVRLLFPALDFPESQEEIQTYSSYDGVSLMEDVSQALEIGLKFEIGRARGLMSHHVVEPRPVGAAPSVAITNLTIPNVGLYSVQQVRVLEDSCTDALQRYLDKGWRIIAVCPPCDARRPTYIVGHINAEPEEG